MIYLKSNFEVFIFITSFKKEIFSLCNICTLKNLDQKISCFYRCENLLMLVNRKKSEPSDAEKAFVEEMKVYSERVVVFGNQMGKLQSKMKYQQVQVNKIGTFYIIIILQHNYKLQIENWKSQEMKKISAINEQHANTIKTNLEDT